MGRTYKRNDLHNSRRPKSIREKRQFNGKFKDNSEDYHQEFSTDYPKRNQPHDYTNE